MFLGIIIGTVAGIVLAVVVPAVYAVGARLVADFHKGL